MSLYVPRGYLTTAQAVERIFAARHPELAADTAARDAEKRRLYEYFRTEFPGTYPPPAKFIDLIRLRDAGLKRHAVLVAAMDPRSALRYHKATAKQPEQPVGKFGEADLARLRELNRIASEANRLHTETSIELRAALAEGDLVAAGRDEAPFSKSRWREDDGLAIVSKGTLSDRVEGAPTQSVEYAVVIREVDLAEWLHSPPTGEPAESHVSENSPAATLNECAGQTASATSRRRGPRPTKRAGIASRMVADYSGRGVVLDGEKEEVLASTYGASRETVRKARSEALGTLNSDKLRQTAPNDK